MVVVIWLGTHFHFLSDWPVDLIRLNRMLETAHVVLIGHYIYWNLISNYCNPAAMTMATDAENVSIYSSDVIHNA